MKKKNAPAFTLIESDRKNTYFYDQNKGNTQWCHPLLYHILKLHDQGTDVDQWYTGLKDGPIHIEGAGPITTTKDEIAYYYRKYTMLREHGFFTPIDNSLYLSGRLTADQIRSSLANSRQVTFEVTDNCNLECEYCTYGKFYDDYDRREKKKLDPAVAKTFLDYLMGFINSPLNHSHDRLIYIGFYGGEPLLNVPFIREIVDYVNRLKPLHNRFCFNMTTNALLLEKNMDFLVEHDFTLLISLDGDEYSNSYRVFKDGSPAYAEITGNIHALKNKYPEYFESRVNFNVVIHNRNAVDDVYRYFKTNFDKIPNLSELSPAGIKDSMRREFWDTYANINESLFQAEDYAMLEKALFTRLPNVNAVSKFVDRCSGFAFDNYNELLSPDMPGEEDIRVPTGTCVPFSRKVFITANGKILPCERIGFQYGVGTVNEKKVDMDFEKMAETYNAYYDKIKSQCRACTNWNDCLQCVFYLDIEEPNPRCSGLMDKKQSSEFLAVNVSYLEENPQIYKKVMKEVMLE
jgi:uncharacterized protein